MKRFIQVGAAAIVGTCLLAGCGQGDTSGFVGKPAADIALSPLHPAGDVKLSNYRGKVVLLDFWATWCGPCRMLMPHLSELQDKYGQKGLVVLGISTEARNVVDAFHQANSDVKYDLFLDPTMAAARKYDASSLPTTVLIGKDGVIAAYDAGFNDESLKALDNKVAELVGS